MREKICMLLQNKLFANKVTKIFQKKKSELWVNGEVIPGVEFDRDEWKCTILSGCTSDLDFNWGHFQ